MADPMRDARPDGLHGVAPVMAPDWPEAPANVHGLVSTRCGGVSAAPFDDGAGGGGLNLGLHVGDDGGHVMQNRQRLRAYLPATPAWLSQVHGSVVLDAASIGVDSAPVADASIASGRQQVCAVLTADCLPVLLCDARGSVVGAAHAGWRGLAGGVLQACVARMRAVSDSEILAWLGPAIGPSCFEVGQDVVDAFSTLDKQAASAFVAIDGKPGKYLADLYLLARLALGAAGVTRVAGGGLCTMSDSRRFYSYRRDGRTGRMASLIWLE